MAGDPDPRAAARAIDAFLRALGRNPERESELRGTGDRVAAAFIDELCAGYRIDVSDLLLRSRIEGTCEAVALHRIAVTTTCPHHLMPALGTAAVAFAPGTWLLGLGTIAALVEAFARRLTLQEQIGQGVVDALREHVAPRWAACRIDLSHTCVTARGAVSHEARAETWAYWGPDDERPLAFRTLEARP